MTIALRRPLLLLMLLCSKAAFGTVDTSILPNDWVTPNTPAQYQRYAEQTGLTLKDYREHPASKAVLIYYTASIQGSARELAAGMMSSLERQQAQAGYSIRLNEIKTIERGEVLQQAWQYGDAVEIRLCELSENPMHQIRMSGSAKHYSQMLATAQSVFRFPKASVQSAAYESGYQMGQVLFWALLVSVAVIIVVWFKTRAQKAALVAGTTGFSLEKLKASEAQTITTSESGRREILTPVPHITGHTDP